MTAPTPVHVYWTGNEYGQTGGGPQPASWHWPAGLPLPEVGDRLRAPQGASPLDLGTVTVLERTWELFAGYGSYQVVLRLDCEWWQS